MKLAVGFLAYNEATAKYLGDFLPSLRNALSFLKPEDYRIYVFDNSDKGDLANSRILAGYQEIVYLSQGHNLGFARAYNLLIKEALKAGAEYFLVINPDTVMEPETIRLLIDALDSDGSLGSAAPRIMRWDFDDRRKTDRIDSLGLVLGPGLKFSDLGQGEKYSSQSREASILGPSGAAGLFRLSALERVAEDGKYFDERFFMYKEDCDLAYRLFLAGYTSRLVPEALVYHDRTAAVSGQGIKDFWQGRKAKSKQVRAWSFRNQHLIFYKYWKKQNIVNKAIIAAKVLLMFIFSLIFEQFLLKQYCCLFRISKGLTNIK